MKRKTNSQVAADLFKNKRFIALLIAAVLALAAIVVVIVICSSGNRGTPGGAYAEDSEIYYYDTAEGEMVLTLYGDYTFSLATFTATKTGSFTKEGDTFTLDFIKDADGTATASFSGEKLIMLYNDATLPFIPRVNYTVTYSGTDFPAGSVVNGKTLTKPADPKKDGYVFFGWYANEELTVPYDFDATVVKSDVTIYAKWVAAENFG